jgi:hypothetical protein
MAPIANPNPIAAKLAKEKRNILISLAVFQRLFVFSCVCVSLKQRPLLGCCADN